ncbi:MAG: S8 family serine peptidase [Cyanobacteria bacterium P01_B01_bin.77]
MRVTLASALVIFLATSAYYFQQISNFASFATEQIIPTDDYADSKFIEDLAKSCRTIITIGDQTSTFEARQNNRVVVKVTDDPTQFEPWGTDQIKVNSVLNHVVLDLPKRHPNKAYNRIKQLENVEWVDSYCVSLDRASDSAAGEAKKCKFGPSTPGEMLVQPARKNTSTRLPECDCKEKSSCSCTVRDVIGLNYISQPSIVNKPPLVAVLDEGVNLENTCIKQALGNVKINDNIVNSWNYCTQSSQVTDWGHGTAMAKIIAGESSNLSDCGLPGVSQGARFFSAQVYESEEIFVDFLVIADAISDAVAFGAKVINASFMFCKRSSNGDENPECEENKTGLLAIEDALNQASDKAVFVTGVQGADVSTDNPVYPAAFDLPNVLAVQAASWNPQKKIMTTEVGGWPLRVDIGVPETINGATPGVSNAIAIMSGSVALLLSHEQCAELKPAQIIEIFRRESANEKWVDRIRRYTNRSTGYLDLRFLQDRDYINALCWLAANS